MNSAYREHDITLASFAQIDAELGAHCFSEAEYALVRRIIHTTADFEFQHLVRFSNAPFSAALAALMPQNPIITDVSMVAAGIRTVVDRTWRVPINIAVQSAAAQSVTLESDATPGKQTHKRKTRSAIGMQQCAGQHPNAIVAVGNAPTALLTLCEGIQAGIYSPALVIGAPVGFINVLESKQALAELSVPHILVTGRKGGSAVAAAILNALMIWAWNQSADKTL